MLQTDLIASIPALLRRHADARGSKPAYRDATTTVTYGELVVRTANLAGHLADNGVQPGDKVAIFLPNSVAWVESCFAINRAAGISVPISYEATESEVLYRLQDAGCTAIIATDERASLIVKLKQDAPDLKLTVLAGEGPLPAGALRYEQLATSVPKSVAARSVGDFRASLYYLHIRHHRPRQGCVAVGSQHVVGHGRMLGADRRIVGERCRSLAAAAVSFLCAQPVGAEHSVGRCDRVHHGEILHDRRRAPAEERRVYGVSGRADDVPLFP